MESPLYDAARVYREAVKARDAAREKYDAAVWGTAGPAKGPSEAERCVLRAVSIRADAELSIAEDALRLAALQGE